ncbi:RNA polymerase sigma factor [Piscinibacterium candidicorallinum]|uniref:RNA polymerase sigma factor n=2 Tax=Piscinibacterium candidicorallinum TaxID=1793872 RepID=A0ABV7H5Q7_9BURK
MRTNRRIHGPDAFYIPLMPDAMTPSQLDAALVARCRQGDQRAWAELVQRYQRLIYTVPRRAGLSEAQSADVFQTVFTRLYEHIDRLADPERLHAWLVTTAKRESLRALEQGRRIVALAGADRDDDAPEPIEQVPDPDPLPEQVLESLQLHHQLRRALDALDERTREFIVLAFLQDPALSYQELAARLGVAEGSIGPTRARCIAKLRAAMDRLS